jgi:hypothetical protein
VDLMGDDKVVKPNDATFQQGPEASEEFAKDQTGMLILGAAIKGLVATAARKGTVSDAQVKAALRDANQKMAAAG